MQVDLNLTQNGTNGEKPTNGVAEQTNGVSKRKLADENEDTRDEIKT